MTTNIYNSKTLMAIIHQPIKRVEKALDIVIYNDLQTENLAYFLTRWSTHSTGLWVGSVVKGDIAESVELALLLASPLFDIVAGHCIQIQVFAALSDLIFSCRSLLYYLVLYVDLLRHPAT